MSSVAHIKEQKKELANDVYKLACLGVRLMRTLNSGVTIQNGF